MNIEEKLEIHDCPLCDGGALLEEEGGCGYYVMCLECGCQSVMIGTALVMDKVWKKPGVFNVEEFDPDPYMDMLNRYGLPWVVDENPQIVE